MLFFRKPVSSTNQQGLRVAQLLGTVSVQILTHRLGISVRRVEQALYTVGTVFPLDIRSGANHSSEHRTEQSAQIAQNPFAQLSPPKAGDDPFMGRPQRSILFPDSCLHDSLLRFVPRRLDV